MLTRLHVWVQPSQGQARSSAAGRSPQADDRLTEAFKVGSSFMGKLRAAAVVEFRWAKGLWGWDEVSAPHPCFLSLPNSSKSLLLLLFLSLPFPQMWIFPPRPLFTSGPYTSSLMSCGIPYRKVWPPLLSPSPGPAFPITATEIFTGETLQQLKLSIASLTHCLWPPTPMSCLLASPACLGLGRHSGIIGELVDTEPHVLPLIQTK